MGPAQGWKGSVQTLLSSLWGWALSAVKETVGCWLTGDRYASSDYSGGETPASIAAASKAFHPSNAHFTRAGYLETPLKAMPSPMRSSAPSSLPRQVIIFSNSASFAKASVTGRPTISSAITEVEAWLIEQPTAS